MDPRMDCIDFINPATGQKFGEVRVATEADVARARREMAAVQPEWAAKSVKERARLVKKIQGVILDAADEITAVVNQDHGKSRLDALHEVFMTVEKVHHYCAHAPEWLGREGVPRGLYFFKRFYSEREPYGVIGIIGPWNYPIDLMIPPIISALLAGNAVLVKPSEVSAATGVLIEQLFSRVPELSRYVRFLHGDARVGQALVRSKPDLLFLTGSVKTGQIVAKMAAEDMIPFMYELGGKDSMIVLEDADREAADDVDECDDDAGDRIAADELARTVHRSVEVGFLRDVRAALAGLVLADQAGVQVGVDRHLLAGHRVQGEARRDFRDAARAVRDHDELDHDQDHEDDHADRVVAADDEGAEGLDDLAGLAVQQDQAGGRDVQRQPEERQDQQHRGEGAELQRLLDVEADHEHDQREGDVRDQQQVQQHRRQRDDHHADDHHHRDGQHEIARAQQRGDSLRRSGRDVCSHSASVPLAGWAERGERPSSRYAAT